MTLASLHSLNELNVMAKVGFHSQLSLCKEYLCIQGRRHLSLSLNCLFSPSSPPAYFRKLSDDEQPLKLRLLAGPSEKALSFVLKENDSGEVNVST